MALPLWWIETIRQSSTARLGTRCDSAVRDEGYTGTLSSPQL
ncbi:hypothetical protein ACIBH1_48135 [Nonomuraea sp. NPDC050663]